MLRHRLATSFVPGLHPGAWRHHALSGSLAEEHFEHHFDFDFVLLNSRHSQEHAKAVRQFHEENTQWG